MNLVNGLKVTARWITLVSTMLLVGVLLWSWSASLRAKAQGDRKVSSVSAASYSAIVAPEQIVAAFGADLSAGISQAQDFDPSAPGIQLPTLLGGLSLEVNGRSAGLFFVSPGQINFQTPPDLEPGTGYVIVRSDKGAVIGSGEIEIRPTAPAIFTANANGQGVPAGVLVRVKTNGAQSFEPIARRNPNTGRFVPLPIDLGPPGERVFLVLYLTGARRVAKPSDTRLLIGGAEFIPDFLGPHPDFVGVEQLNFELPRSLSGELSFALAALGFPTSNICQIEVAPPSGTPPRIAGLNLATTLAGERLEVFGSGLPASLTEEGNEVLIADANNRRFNAKLEEATPTRLHILVPFGAGSGHLIVRTPRGESTYPFAMRTSVSGIIQTAQLQANGQTLRVGLRNVTVRAFTANGVIERTTNDDGAFLLPDVPPALRMDLELDGTTTGLPYPKPKTSLRVSAGRDNQFEGYLELKQVMGATVPTSAAGLLPEAAFSTPAAATPKENALTGQTGQVVFEPHGSTAQFPDGTRVNELKVTALDPGRTPANLPEAHFSTTIVQITPFGARLTPGGKLTFPNTDSLAAGSTATLYRYDQTPGSETLGRFVVAGTVTVSADGQRVETARDAIKETTYYFVSIPRASTTVYGSVLEEDSTPARGALVQVRGQSIFALTDQRGAFILPNVPLIGAQDLTLEVSYLRADGTVDRTERSGVRPTLGALTFVSPPIVLPGRGRTRAPVILAPKTLAIVAGQNSEFPFLAYARVAGQTLRSVTVSGASFAAVLPQGNDRYTLRLTPAANVTGAFTLTLMAIDSQGLRTDEAVALEVRAPNTTVPSALSQSVITNEDTPVNIMLSGSGGNLYRVISQPRFGTLSGTAPNLSYTPARDFNGTDGFNFTVSNATTTSSPAMVSIAVRAINDAPCFGTDRNCSERSAATYTTNIGQTLNVVLNGFDVDVGQKLTLTATGLPTGATITQTTATSWLFAWTPKFDQLGSYPVNLTLRDDGVPVLSDSRTVTIVVDAKWAGTSQLGTSGAISLAVLGNMLFAGTYGYGVYRSTDNGVTWTAANGGLPNAAVNLRMHSLGVKDNALFAGTEAGPYRSTDKGVSWTAANSGMRNQIVYHWAVKDNALFAGTEAGVFRSTDNGMSWIPASNGLRNTRYIAGLVVKDNALFVGFYGSGVFRSTDAGANWTAVNSGLRNPYYVYCLVVKDHALFVGTNGYGVYRTTDNGASWAAVNNGLGDPRIKSLVIKDNVLFAGAYGGDLHRTTDNGASWAALDSGLGDLYVAAWAVKDNALFAGIYSRGVFRSSDDGANWTALNSGLGTNPVNALIVKDNALFAGADAGGVFRTTDNGANWTAVNNGFDLKTNSPYALAIKDTALFAGTAYGVYRSTDNGASWTPAGLKDQVVNALAVKDNALFAGTEYGGVFRTADNGVTWTAVNNGLGNNAVAALAVKDNALFAGTHTGTFYAGTVFRSTDNGATWTAANNGLGNQRVNAFTTKDNALFAGGSGGVYRTTDNGASWTAADLRDQYVYALTVKDNALFAGTTRGVYRTTDNGAHWTAINGGLGSTFVRALAVKDNALITGTFGGIFFLTESATTWTESKAGLTNRNINAATLNGESFLVGTFGGGIFRSTDKGQSWSPANTGLPPAADVRAFTSIGSSTLASLAGEGVFFSNDQGRSWSPRSAGLTNRLVNALAGDGATVYAGTNGGVFRSTDGGALWTAANTGLTRAQVLSLSVSSDAVYVGTDNGLFRSTNQGASWTEVSTGLTDRYIIALGVALDGTTLLAGTSNGLFRSTNQGQSWTPVTPGLPERVVALTFAQQGRRLLAGTVNGFFVSEDNGASWRQINGGLLTLQVGALAVSGQTVLAGTRSGGVFVSQLPQ